MNNDKFEKLMAYIIVTVITLVIVALGTKAILWIFGV